MRLHELEPPDGIEPVSRANQDVAFAKISRPSFTCRSSRFSRPLGRRPNHPLPMKSSASNGRYRSAGEIVSVRSEASCVILTPLRFESSGVP